MSYRKASPKKGHSGKSRTVRFETLKLAKHPRPACRHDELDLADLEPRRCLGHCNRLIRTDRAHRVCTDCTRHNESARPVPSRCDGVRRCSGQRAYAE